MITVSTLRAAVAIEAAAVSARTSFFQVAIAMARIAAHLWARRMCGAGYVTWLTTLRRASFATSNSTLRTNGSATGARNERKREHENRAFHLFPLKDLGRRRAKREARSTGARG
jgi:hypothetical protein